jgi:hypothetical protein
VSGPSPPSPPRRAISRRAHAARSGLAAELRADVEAQADAVRGLFAALNAEVCVWRLGKEELAGRLRDLRAQSAAEVALWRARAEGLEAGFVRRKDAEAALWRFEYEAAAAKCGEARAELARARWAPGATARPHGGPRARPASPRRASPGAGFGAGGEAPRRGRSPRRR